MNNKEPNGADALDGAWQEAHRRLLENAERRPFVSRHELSTSTIYEGKRVYLPAYIPYIGARYFQSQPRILCYAINQNLSPHVRWTEEWVTRWAADIEHARDRLNRAVWEGRPIPIRPYAEGFIPLAALLACSKWNQTHGGHLPDCIDDVLSVTNFIKFSTAEDASSSSIPVEWWRECAASYVETEIRTLRPDVIVAFGQRTAHEVARVAALIEGAGDEPVLLGCRFPARIPSLRARPLTEREGEVWASMIGPLTKRMREPPSQSYHRWKIHNYPGYFLDIVRQWGLIG